MSKSEELAFLRSSLQKEAGQVLWDFGSEAASTLKQLKKMLQERFGRANQADKYRLEIRIRRRGKNDALNEPNFASKVRERNPMDLDEVFRIATQVEI